MHDPVVEETREVRRRISAECGHDAKRLVAYYVERQQALRRETPERFTDHDERKGEEAARSVSQ